MNAPEAGTIKEYLANEEDTVTVGQDLLKLDLDGTPKGGDKQEGGQEPKAPAAANQPTSSDPKPKKDTGASVQDPSTSSSSPSPSPTKRDEHSKQTSKQNISEKESNALERSSETSGRKKPFINTKESEAPYGNREERRVCFLQETVC